MCLANRAATQRFAVITAQTIARHTEMKPNLHIETYGDGHDVHFGIPGFGAPHEKSFGDVVERMPEHIKFYGVDPPGIGKSPQPSEWTWDTVTDLLLESLEHTVEEVGEPIRLVGACSGGFHALEMATRRPDLISELVLIEPFGYMPWFVRALVIPGLGYSVFHAMFGTETGRGLIQAGLTARGLTGGFDTMSSFANARAEDLHTYLRFYRNCEIRGAQFFKDIDVPKRLFHGSGTFGAVKDALPMWQAMWKDLEIITIDGVGHQVTQEDPDQLVAKMF